MTAIRFGRVWGGSTPFERMVSISRNVRTPRWYQGADGAWYCRRVESAAYTRTYRNVTDASMRRLWIYVSTHAVETGILFVD